MGHATPAHLKVHLAPLQFKAHRSKLIMHPQSNRKPLLSYLSSSPKLKPSLALSNPSPSPHRTQVQVQVRPAMATVVQKIKECNDEVSFPFHLSSFYYFSNSDDVLL